MPGGPSEITSGRVGDGQLADPEGCAGVWEEVGREEDAAEVIEAPSELAVHLIFPECLAEDKMHHVVHPFESLAVS